MTYAFTETSYENNQGIAFIKKSKSGDDTSGNAGRACLERIRTELLGHPILSCIVMIFSESSYVTGLL